MAAELAGLVEGSGDAPALYDRAIALAHEHGALAHEALANELCGRHFLARGRARIAQGYMTDAHYAYGRWGATAKVLELAPYILIERSSAPREAGASQIDALAVVRASQAISTEIVLSRLVQSLMRIVIEQAGADVPGFDIAAAMVTAGEVGGDYYDLLRTGDGGCWLGIGDVSGHGLNAGLVMLMIQSGLATLMRSNPHADPASLVDLLNQMLYENIRVRLGRDDFATLSLFRFYPG